MASAGRKKKAEDDRRDDQIRVRVSAEEHDLLERAAKIMSIDLSSWMRSLAVGEARKVLQIPPDSTGAKP